MIGEGIQINEYQTPFGTLEIDKEPQEVQDQFWDCINNIPLVRSLISADRPRAKDLPRDELGRIIVDITKPHILEDMDYFRQTAITFQKTGQFTHLRPNGNPNSEYMKWLKEEVRRCIEGYVRPSDGEWITGDYYFFLNYCPILQADTSDSGKTKGKKMAKRISDFPKVWEGHYLRTHYLQQARENGNHASELSRRGSGKSYVGGSLLSKRFVIGESKEVCREVQCVVTAYEKKYISGANQILDMFKKYIDFLAINTELPSKRLVDSAQNLTWKMGYKDLDTGADKGTLNSVIGITSKDDESKLRGSRGVLYIIEEAGCHIEGTEVIMADLSFKKVENIIEGDRLLGPDGTERTVLKVYSGEDDLYKITLSNGDWQIVNSTHPVRFIKHNWYTGKDEEKLLTAPELLRLNNLDGHYIEKAKIEYPKVDIKIDPYFLGLWLGDGDSSRASISNKDREVLEWLNANYTGNIRSIKQSQDCKVFHIPNSDGVYKYLKWYNLINNKHIPNEYIYNSTEVGLKLLAGLIDTDGNYNRDKHYFEITQRYDRKQILDAAKAIATNAGLKCSITSRIANGKKPGVLHYRLRISGNISIIPTKIERKKAKIEKKYRGHRNWSHYTFKVEPYKKGNFYGFTLDKDSLFILKDGTIVHNTFPRLLGLYATLRPSVEDGDSVFGLIYAYGTSGDEDSDFAALQEIMYNPKGYNMYALKNVYDKEGQGRPNFVFFFPGYMNRSNCYDDNGNSDVTKAILEILKDRFTVKYNSSDVNAVTKRISEIPITPQEAILRAKSNLFPITDLNERLNQIDNNPSEFDDVYVGNLVPNDQGGMEFRISDSLPIRDFPIKDNKNEGAIEIFKMPERDHNGKVFENRYIIGHDPVDDDEAHTASLTSTFVLDLFTDQIVAEYTGRNMMAEDNFEIVRRLCIFYNAKCLYESNKKGIFAYFQEKRCIHLLADTPQYLKDVDVIKSIGFGNKAKGVNATIAVNTYANKLIKEWLLKVNTSVKTLPFKDDNGVEYYKDIEVQEFNLYNIRNRALLKELIQFNADGNFDRVRALGMVMLYRQQYLILYEGNVKDGMESYDDADYLGNDPFFSNNYGK
jgi:hypothetical protein